MSKKSNFIKITDSMLEQINYDDNYEIIMLLNICKHLNANYLAWGEKSFFTSPTILLNEIVEQEEPSRKIQQTIINSLQSLIDKNIMEVEGERLTWASKIKIVGDGLVNRMSNARPSITTFITMEELKILMAQPIKEQSDLIKAYLYLLSRMNISNIESLAEHQGEFTLYDFDQNDNFNFTFMSDTIDYMRCRKNYRIECDNNWIGRKQLSDTLKKLSDIGLIKSTTRSIANGCNKGLITKRNFYYLPIIEDWKMDKVIDRYVSRRNWTETNKNTPQS